MSFDDIDLNDIDPKDRKLVQECLALPAKRRFAIFDKLEQVILRGRMKPLEMRALDPALVWSRSWIEGCDAVFFQRPVGYTRPDGGVSYWKDTNIMMAGCLGMPLQLELREVRIYAGVSDAFRWKEEVQGAFLEEYIYAGDHKRKWKLEGSFDHVPLPEPETFDPEKEPDRVDLRERARELLSEVNGARLPCFSVNVERTIQPNECICFSLRSGNRILPPGLESIVVMIGKLWTAK